MGAISNCGQTHSAKGMDVKVKINECSDDLSIALICYIQFPKKHKNDFAPIFTFHFIPLTSLAM